MKDRLKECRLRCNYTQKFVALSVGVSMPTVSQWEAGIKNPSVENLIRLADLYDASVDYLVGRDVRPPEPRPQQFNQAEMRMLEVYRSLNSHGKEYIRQQLTIASRIYIGERPAVPFVENE